MEAHDIQEGFWLIEREGRAYTWQLYRRRIEGEGRDFYRVTSWAQPKDSYLSGIMERGRRQEVEGLKLYVRSW